MAGNEQSPFVTAIQRVATALGVLMNPRRALKFSANFTLTDVPSATLKGGGGQGEISGYTLIEVTGGVVVNSIGGSNNVGVDSSDPKNPFVYLIPTAEEDDSASTFALRDANSDLSMRKAQTTGGVVVSEGGTFAIVQTVKTSGNGGDASITAQDGQQSGNTSGGFVNVSGGLGHGAGAAGGVRLKLGATTILEVVSLADLGGAPALLFGSSGGFAALVARSDAALVGLIVQGRASGAPTEINVVGQDNANGDGGDVKVTAGTSAGGGVHGRIKFRIGGVTVLEGTPDAMLIAGDPTNGATVSLELCGPVGTTVGAAGVASALPATPQEYLLVKNSAGQNRKIPLYLP